MAITSPEEFLQALGKSKLLTPEQLAHAQDTVLLTGNAEEFAEILIDEGFLTEWQASRLLAGQTEFIIGNYVLLGLLGRGGMGSVFLARHTTMKRQVALKIISRKVGKDPASRDRFLSEARSAAALDHPNIVRAFDVDKDSERFYIVMEYVAGVDLEALVQQEGPLDFEFLVSCIHQAAEGLAHAHRRNMAHCDIKPSNLLVTETGVVKILDMGMARLLNQSVEDSGGDREGQVLGTVDYMAPEQAVQGPNFDHRADVYSLGCTMYYLLTGHPPFDQGTLTQRIVQHQTEPPPDILAERPDTPPELARICLKMMAKDPADRFQSADELAEVLAQWQPPPPQLSPEQSEAAAKPTSTGVAIDEEEFKTAPLESAESGDEPKSLLADERRLIFWMAAVAIIVGGLLVIAVVVFMTASGDTDGRPPQGPVPRANAPDGEDAPPVPKQAPEATPEQDLPQTQSGQAGTPAAEQPDEPKVHPPKTRKSPSPNEELRELGLAGTPTTPGGAPSDTAGQPETATPPTGESPPADTPEPEAKPKPSDPLEDFPETVALPPAAESGQPIVLGKVLVTAEDQPELQLLGGEFAIRGDGLLVMEPRPEASQWVVRVVDSAGASTDVAQFSLRGEELTFVWLDVPKDAPADHLRNCLLAIRVGRWSRVVRFVNPEAVDPFTFSLGKSKGTAQKRLPLKNPPQEAVMRLVITAIDGLPGKSRFKPVTLVPGETKDIVVLRHGGCKIVLQTRYTLSASAGHLDMTAYCHLASRGQSRLSASRMPSLVKQGVVLEEKEQRITFALENNPRLSDADKKSRNEELRKVQGEYKWLKQFFQWYQGSNGVVQVQFQEFIVVGKHRIVLLDTRQPAGE